MNRNKLRSVLIFGGIAAAVAYLTPHVYHRHAEPSALSAEGPRTPAGESPLAQSFPPLAANPSVCQNIYQSVCQHHGETHDPTGTVVPDVEGDRQAVRFYEELIEQHPDWSAPQVDDALVAAIYTPKRRGRVQSAFHFVEHTLLKFIDNQPEEVFSAREKRQLKARVRKTQLQLPVNAATYSDEPDLFTKNEVFYERMLDGQMRMRVGGAYLLTAKSWFNIVFTLGHEFAHAIDPCEIRSAHMSLPAYDRLTACFLRNNLIATHKTRLECEQDDQLSETFADWVAVHIAAEALRSYSAEFPGVQLWNAATNSVRDLCEQEDDLDLLDVQYHPPPQVRIEAIFGRNPEIRQVLGCNPAPEPEYCDFKTTSPNHVSPSRRIGGKFRGEL